MFETSPERLLHIEGQLLRIAPPAESDLKRILDIAAKTWANTETGARVRRHVLDFEDLLDQIRWHLGQALLLFDLCPKELESTQEREDVAMPRSLPADLLLVLRKYTAETHRVMFEDLRELRRGVPAVGWIFHMVVDSAIFRAVAALDLVAHIVWCAAGKPLLRKDQTPVRVYFRTRRMSEVHETLNLPATAALAALAAEDLVSFLIAYRDGLSHEFKHYSYTAGALPSDQWQDSTGQTIRVTANNWSPDDLFALANGAYHQVVRALSPLAEILQYCTSASVTKAQATTG